MRTTITIEGPGLHALAVTLRELADAANRALAFPPARVHLTSQPHTIATYHRDSTAVVRIEEPDTVRA